MDNKVILIAAAHSGGHLKPAYALAQELKKRDNSREIIFIGTGKSLEDRIIKEFSIVNIKAKPILGKKLKDKVIALSMMPFSLIKAYSVLKHFNPSLIIGCGGYVTGPLIIAGKILSIPSIIMEQNSIPGITNQILCNYRFVKKVYSFFPESKNYLKHCSVDCLGNPLVESITKLAHEDIQFNFDNFTILILGGSQGAKTLNEKIPVELSKLKDDLKCKIKVIHQTGTGDWNFVQKTYDKAGIHAQVIAFIDDMSAVYKESTMVISRAGATTIAELTALGKPTIFIPFPYAARNHQYYNAKSLVESGAAFMLTEDELNGIGLAKTVTELISNQEQFLMMSQLMKKFGKPDATNSIVDDIERIISERP